MPTINPQLLATSNSYQFGTNAKVDDLINAAFLNIEVTINQESPLQLKSAIYAANLELSTWGARGFNLFQVRPMMLTLMPGQSTYQLPNYVIRIPFNECALVQPFRLNTSGVAFSTEGGNAGNCFDPTQTGGCIQTAPNGSIGYNYGTGVTPSILYFGITTLVQSTYCLAIEFSLDGITWNTIYTSSSSVYYPGIPQWIVLQYATSAQYWRVTETQGATLQIQQLYFSIPNTVSGGLTSSTSSIGNQMIQAISRSMYLANQVTQTPANSVSGYYVNETTPPILVAYPTPNTVGTNLLYNALCYPPDVVYLFQNIPVPQKFIDALLWGISWRLAVMFNPQKIALMLDLADKSYQLAGKADFENVPLNFTPNTTQFSTGRS